MDREWVLTQLEDFIRNATLEGIPPDPAFRDLLDDRPTYAPHDVLVAEAHVVEQILDRVMPDWGVRVPEDRTGRWQQHREAAQRALVQVRRERELREKLGENAPTLDASRFHRWAWHGARSMWASRHFGQGVVDALKRVNAETQNKSNVHTVGEVKLFQQLFSTNPTKPGDIRLRLHPDDGSDLYTDVHRGARALAEGLFAGIRNISAHTVAENEVDEQRALEQLAAVSVLARWIDEATVVTTPWPPD